MDPIDLEFRPGKPADAEQAIPLIYSSGPAEFDYVLAMGDVRSPDYLRTAFVARKNTLGCEHFTVAVADNRVAGIGACYNGSEYRRMEMHSVWPAIRFYGLRNSIEMFRKSRHLEEVLPRPDNDTGYLTYLGVAPDLRGRGIGTALIEHLIETARKKNRRICALDVAVTNPRSQSLYERLGFKVVSETKWSRRATAERVEDFRRMELVL